jgi:hypothetical protein
MSVGHTKKGFAVRKSDSLAAAGDVAGVRSRACRDMLHRYWAAAPPAAPPAPPGATWLYSCRQSPPSPAARVFYMPSHTIVTP